MFDLPPALTKTLYFISLRLRFQSTLMPNFLLAGHFLYLLGRPTSDVSNFTDKSLTSSLIRESGNNCSVQIKLWYQNVRGTVVELGTQNLANAYSPIHDIIFLPSNDTTHTWKNFTVRFGRYLDPFSIYVDVRRSRQSKPKSFIAIDSIRLLNCEPKSSVPIDCSKQTSRYYNCPGGQGWPCLDGPSMLCDLKPDCPNGDDEKEEACLKMPLAARCDFNVENDMCGWYDPSQIQPSSSVAWRQKSGKSKMEGIQGDLSSENKGHYLYLEYEAGQMSYSNFGAVLRSPTFPPPPKYNNNASSPYYRSCRARLNYHARSTSITPGPLELLVQYVNDSSENNGYSAQYPLSIDNPMGKNKEGWIRWEAVLDTNIQLRYHLVLLGFNTYRGRAELAVDDFSLSPQCFGLGVPEAELQGWRYNMTDLEFCEYYGRSGCVKPKPSYGYTFTTCDTIIGPLGPYQEHCDVSYNGTATNVLIGDSSKTHNESHHMGYVTGIQRWKVPFTGIYTFIVCGASGARGRQNNVQSRADKIVALVPLEANETLFILVGQMGTSYCEYKGVASDQGRCDGLYYNAQGRRKRSTFYVGSAQPSSSMGGVVINGRRGQASGQGHNGPMIPRRRGNSISEIARMMALSDSATPSSENVGVDDDDSSSQQTMGRPMHGASNYEEAVHGRVHSSPDTHLDGTPTDIFTSIDQAQATPAKIEGGGGGGGSTIIFRFLANGTVQPLLIAGGGGGSSDRTATKIGQGRSTGGNSGDARGLINSRAAFEDLLPFVSKGDTDAGSGGGWTTNLSYPANFSVVYLDFQNRKNRSQPTGFSSDSSWMGGLPCSPKSHQMGGFGGGGAGCHGGGGGGGYIGGHGGVDEYSNGEGGWSYVHPDAVLRLIDDSSDWAAPSSRAIGGSPGAPPGGVHSGHMDTKLGKHSGPGQVHILPPLVNYSCQTNCSEFGATCVALDIDRRDRSCVCPNGIILDHLNPHCSNSLPLLLLVLIGLSCVVATAILGLLCLFLYTQYQRKHMQIMRRKMRNGPESQLNQLRAMNGARNGNGNGGIMMTEYNPNYEFGGGTCTLQDLREIPREHLRLVKALGQGAFGEVYQGFYKKSLNDTLEMAVAVKTLPELSSNQAEMDFLMEALIMSKFNHPNIVHFIGVCFDKHPRFIILELLAGGDLKTFLRDSRPKPDRASPLVMKDLLSCAMDVAKGCEYLEGNHFIHRDIAARNCLLTTKGPGRVVKIADFGMARDIYRADYYRKGGKAMLPVKWMPPEAFLDGIFTSKTDIWSFGILLWEVMSLGYMPYPGRGNQEVMQLVTNGGRLEPPNYCPGPVYGLMCQCWHPIPEERPNFRTILERLGYCMQDPEVVMAPLPMFHRPLSLDNSRETSLSSGRGGGRSTGPDTSGSGSGVSLPMRPHVGHNNNNRTASTPDSPSTTLTSTLPAASSSDYLVPLAGLPARPAPTAGSGQLTQTGGPSQSRRAQVPGPGRKGSHHSGGTPMSSPSDDPVSCSDTEDAELLISASRSNIKTLLREDEAETSFTCSPPTNNTGRRRSGGYTSLLAQNAGQPLPKRVRPAGCSQNGSNRSSSSSSSNASSCHAGQPSRTRSRSTQPLLLEAIEPPKRTTSVIQAPQNPLPPLPPNASPQSPALSFAPPPPPRGYSDVATPITSKDDSPVLPPLPPLPVEDPKLTTLDVSSLKRVRPLIGPQPFINMDSPNDVIGGSSSGQVNATPFTIHASSTTVTPSVATTGSNRPNEAPHSEISV